MRSTNVKELLLTQGMVTLVDDEWFPILSKWNWYAQDSGWGYYAARDIGGRHSKMHVYMHRYILMAPDEWEVDHKNGNKLDNQEHNLRILKPSWNRSNKGPMAKNTTGYKGVSFDKSRQVWIAHIQFQRKQYNLGRFTNKDDAARAYNEKAKELHGEAAWLNEIKE